MASGIPGPMTPVTTSYDLQQLKSVKISWAEPDDNSEPIIDYEILILQSDGTLSTSTECDGSKNPVNTQLHCFVLLSTLRSPYYNLPFQ